MCGMEINEPGFLEELQALRRDCSSSVWETHMPTSETTTDFHYCNDAYNFDIDEYPNAALPVHPNIDPLGQGTFPAPILDQEAFFPCPFSAAADIADSSIDTASLPPLPDDWPVLMMEEGVMGLGAAAAACKLEPAQSTDAAAAFGGGGGEFSLDRKKLRGKRVEGQPSKNLMAERRRRKRLNDRLSMLRSVVPKISKMDRTSILGDTIDYMKELLERISNLQDVEVEDKSKGVKSDDILVRNSPKFNAERRDTDTRIEIACAARPGLLLSTVKTLEELGLEIEQCVISCFNDFAMQASCSEELEQRRVVSCEDIKQALFRIAGYGGRCL